MCDYSLHVFPNRLASEGEELVVHRFGGTSLGLASRSDLARVQTRAMRPKDFGPASRGGSRHNARRPNRFAQSACRWARGS
jgi:hypothetical protein